MNICRKIILSVFLFVVSLFVLSGNARAATVNYYVDPSGTNDGSHGTASGTDAWSTIKYAVDNVANPTTDTIIINVSAGTYSQDNTDLLIDRNFSDLTIKGAGASSTFVQPAVDLSSSTSRVFYVGSSENVTLRDMTIRYGKNEEGTAIYHASYTSTLSLINCRITDNHRPNGSWDTDTAAVRVRGNINIENCTFDNNEGERASALYIDTYDHPEVFTKINNSTFYNNPISENSGYGGAIVFGSDAHVILTNTTIHQGSANGNGLSNNNNDVFLYLKNTIISDPEGAYFYSIDLDYGYYADDRPEITDGGYNIIETQTSGAKYTFTDGVNGNLVGDQSNLNLASGLSLNNSTNETPTLALLSGSIALNAGDNAIHGPVGNQVTPSSTDQRGVARNGTIDMGAFEAGTSDDIDPVISSSSLAGDNSYLDITFSEGVYNTSVGSGAVEVVDFDITLSDAAGVSAAAIDSVTNTSGGSLSGGETTVRFNLDLTGSSYGTESVTITPVDGISVYDGSGNPLYSGQTTGAQTLNGATFNYYVDPVNGTDDGSHGTASGTDAWATIAYAVTNVPSPATTTIIINLADGAHTLGNSRVDTSSRGFMDLTLQGAGTAETIIQPHSDPNQSTTGSFYIRSGNTVSFKDLTIRYGRSINGSAIESRGTDGNPHTVTIENCLIDNNRGSSYGAIYFIDTNLVMNNSTVTNNYASSYAGALYTSDGYAKITNSTFQDNTTGSYSGTMYLLSDEAVLTNVTVAGGGASYGGSVYIQAGNLYLKNNILTSDVGRALDAYGSRAGRIYSNGYNIIESRGTDARSSSYSDYQSTDIFWDSGQSRWEDESGNEVSGSLNLGDTLADNNTRNGTQTLALSENSLAIDNGDDAIHGPTGYQVSPPATDQRGLNRIGTFDIGAYEYGAIYDDTAPVVSDVSEAPDENSATITWTTDEAGSSRVEYGMTTSYGMTSSEADTDTRVTSHSYDLSGLQSCRRYFYRVKSKDSANNEGVSAQGVFETAGCVTSIDSGTQENIPTASGGEFELSNNSSVAKLTVPDGFASQNADFQINRLSTNGLTPPTGKALADENVFDFSALAADNSDLTSFDKNITFTLTYGSNTEESFLESTLDVYRYNTGTSEWDDKDCTLDTEANTLTCSLEGFSTYAVFGETSGDVSSGSESSNGASGNDEVSQTNPAPEVCADMKPGSAPDLFQIDTSFDSATLYFTPVLGVNNFYVSFSKDSGAEEHGALVRLGNLGVQSYTVDFLEAGQTYYFKVRAQNGCMPGDWSLIKSASTQGGVSDFNYEQSEEFLNQDEETSEDQGEENQTVLKEDEAAANSLEEDKNLEVQNGEVENGAGNEAGAVLGESTNIFDKLGLNKVIDFLNWFLGRE